MSKLTKALTAAAGNAAAEPLYVEDVFSSYLYEGTGAAQTITNGIDLDGEGGLVWIKDRTAAATNHVLFREPYTALYSNTTSAEVGRSGVTAYNSNGFSLGSYGYENASGDAFASWTFRKAEKFFDVVTWTGNATAGRQISHSLGSAPAFIITKRRDGADNWKCYHVGNPSPAEDYVIELDNINAAGNESIWNDTAPTATNFTVSAGAAINGSGMTYVAYLFASDAGGFGDDGSESVIKCGSYTGTGVAGLEVDLGFEPQWLMFKRTDSTSDWSMFDNMRGIPTGGDDARLRAQGTDVENTFNYVDLTATGFSLSYGGVDMNASGGSYIYIAIRRPMKTPTAGTEVFSPSTFAGTDPTPTVITTGFPVDLALLAYRDLAAAGGFGFTPRLTQSYLYSPTTAAEVSTGLAFDSNTSFATDANAWNQSPSNLIGYGFKRATGFFDVVAYTGTGSATTQAHNLGVVPELMIIKNRVRSVHWAVYSAARTSAYTIALESTGAEFSGSSYWNATDPTASVFTVNTHSAVNQSGENLIAYLFASVAGVSKVGSYTGTGADLNVDCGFSAGARFVMIKRTDSTGDWYVWDTERGIIAGNDPYLLMNSTAAEVTSTDYIDPLSSGFTVTSTAPAGLNASGGTYIFLAIA